MVTLVLLPQSYRISQDKIDFQIYLMLIDYLLIFFVLLKDEMNERTPEYLLDGTVTMTWAE